MTLDEMQKSDEEGRKTPDVLHRLDAYLSNVAEGRKHPPGEVAPGEYRKTEEDKAADQYLLEHNYPPSQINDPYGIRGGKPRDGEQSVGKSSAEGPTPGPSADEPAAAPEASPAPPLSARAGQAFAPETPKEEPPIEPPVDLSGGGDRSSLASAPPPPGPPREDTEMQHAMEQSDLRRKIGTIFNLMGMDTSPAVRQPLEDLAMKRGLEREHFQDEQQREAQDPSSRSSRMLQAVAIKRFGWAPADAQHLVAADLPMVQAGFNAEETFKARTEGAKQRAKSAQGEQDVQMQKARWEHEDRQAKAGAGVQGKPMDAKSTQTMAGLDSVDKIIDRMPTSTNPFEWKRWQAAMNDQMASTVGLGRLNRILMQRVKEMLPGVDNAIASKIPYVGELYGTPDQIKQELRTLVQDERKSFIDIERQSGHNTAGVEAMYGPGAERQSPNAQPPSTRGFGPNMRGGVPGSFPQPSEGATAENPDVFEEPPNTADQGAKPIRTSQTVKEPGGRPAPGPKGGGEARVNVIMANGRPASLPASQVDAARKAGAIR